MDMDITSNIIDRQLLATYSFAAVAERIDESLVVMKLLFDLDHGNLVVLSSKKYGGYNDERKCLLLE